MKKLVALMLVGLLALTIVGPAAAAKKKKKKKPVPVELQYFLRATESCAEAFLSLEDAEDVDCVYADMTLNPVYGATGLVDPVLHYPAADGLPITLDPSRKVAASISTRGWNSTGVGASDWTFTLIATIDGEEKEIATHSESQVTGPADASVLEFEMELDPEATTGAVAEELRLDIYIEGPAVARGVEHDEPVSSIVVPAFE